MSPVSWLIARDVQQGRGNLDFSRWSVDPVREPTPRQRLSWMCREARDGAMPPWPYVLLHPGARLDDGDVDRLCAWTGAQLAALGAGPRTVGTAASRGRAGQEVPIIGGPCEGCEAVFDGLPADPPAVARLGPADEPGEPLRIEGTVTDAAGRPAPGVIVYAYHTDARGVYPPDPGLDGSAARHGRLRGWARTDPDGRYRFDTVRPASYPDGETPAHVHMHVIEPGCCTYFIDSIRFLDDPRLEDEGDPAEARGGSGRVRPERSGDGWAVRRDIRLGASVPGYRPARP